MTASCGAPTQMLAPMTKSTAAAGVEGLPASCQNPSKRHVATIVWESPSTQQGTQAEVATISEQHAMLHQRRSGQKRSKADPSLWASCTRTGESTLVCEVWSECNRHATIHTSPLTTHACHNRTPTAPKHPSTARATCTCKVHTSVTQRCVAALSVAIAVNQPSHVEP